MQWVIQPRGAVEHVRMVVTPETFVRPAWTLYVEGYGGECRALLGGISPG